MLRFVRCADSSSIARVATSAALTHGEFEHIRSAAIRIGSDVFDGIEVSENDFADLDYRRSARSRRFPIGRSRATQSLDTTEFFGAVAETFARAYHPIVSLQVSSAESATSFLEAGLSGGFDGPLWIRTADPELASAICSLHPSITSIHVTRLHLLKGGLERHLHELRETGVHGVSMTHSDWTKGLVTLTHRFERIGIGDAVTHPRMVDEFEAMGLDASSAIG